MILILTYHKMARSKGVGETDFYTISETTFRHELKMLREAGRSALEPHRLQQKDFSPDNFVLTFDDGTIDHFEIVLPVLEEFQMRGIFFIPTTKIDGKNYVSRAQVRQISEAGHVVGCHSHEHRRLDESNDAQIREQLKTSTGILEDLCGKKILFFCPPGGYFNQRIRDIAGEFGFEVIRTMKWGYNKNLDLKALETIPVNSNMDEKQFKKVLEFQRNGLLYAGKETLKHVLPLKSYERLRNAVFRIKS